MIHPDFRYNEKFITTDNGEDLLKEWKQEASPWEQSHLEFMLEWMNKESHIGVQTSGSTGRPTEFQVPKQSMAASAAMTAKYFDCFQGTSALLALPSTYIAGKMMLVRAMTLGWKLTAIEPTSTPMAYVQAPFGFAAFTPMQLAVVSEEQLELLNQFGVVLVGGAAVTNALRKVLSKGSGNFFETYGMAETLSHVALRPIQSTEQPFQALPGVTFTADDQGRLRIHAPHISSEIFQSRDVVQIVSDTSFLYRGRYDRVINSGGIKLFAEVIEEKLSAIIDVPFCISSLPDDTLGQRVVIYIETERPIVIPEWKEKVRSVLDKYEVPKEIIPIRRFTRTHSGKILINQ